jgi:pullulanase
MEKTEQIQKHLKFSEHYMPGIIAYELSEHANNDDWQFIQVIFNNNPHPVVFPVEKRKWKEITNGLTIDEKGLSEYYSDTVFVPAVSMILLASNY